MREKIVARKGKEWLIWATKKAPLGSALPLILLCISLFLNISCQTFSFTLYSCLTHHINMVSRSFEDLRRLLAGPSLRRLSMISVESGI